MRLLIAGGTRFLGRHVAELALQRGHRVTLLHRGQSGCDLFPDAEHRIADRDGDLAVLADGAAWDATIDTSAYVPRQVRALGAALGPRAGHYQLVSSISAYAAFAPRGQDETAPLAVLADPASEALGGDSYGGLKALCEKEAARGAFGATGRGAGCLVVRPGLIVGPHDRSGRFTWWARRLAQGGRVLAPGDPSAPVQWIDVRDLAAWMLAQAEARSCGTFNLCGPAQPCTLGALLDTGRWQLAPTAELSWVDEAFLVADGIAPWTELPLWLRAADAGLHRIDNTRALATGLQCRPAAQTFADTAAWAQAHGPDQPPGIGLAPAKEADLLARWDARVAS